MRYVTILAGSACLVALSVAVSADAQRAGEAGKARREAAERKQREESCKGKTGPDYDACVDPSQTGQIAANERIKANNKETKLVSDALMAGNAKQTAKDYAGAITDYQGAITAYPGHPGMLQINTALAAAYRNQAIAAFNAGGMPQPPAAGATNDQIRAYNAAVGAAQAQRAASIRPMLINALNAASTAAAMMTDPTKNTEMVRPVGIELREAASLLFQIDRAGTLTTPRSTIDTEVAWLKTWMAGSPAPGTADLSKYGFATAAGLLAKDKAAGLTLADEIYAKTSGDIDGKLGHAEIVAAAKLPAADPRRAKASADLAALEAMPTNDSQKSRIRRIKAALSAPA